MGSTAKSAILAAGGGLVGFLAETVHRRAEVWSLPAGGPMPLWVALAYAVGLFAALEGARRFEAGRTLALGPQRVTVEAALVVALFLLPPLLHRHELALFAVAATYLAARLVRFREPGDLAFAAACVALDAVLEGSLVAAGLFRYTNAVLPLPLWLPPLWGGLGLGLRRMFAFARPASTATPR